MVQQVRSQGSNRHHGFLLSVVITAVGGFIAAVAAAWYLAGSPAGSDADAQPQEPGAANVSETESIDEVAQLPETTETTESENSSVPLEPIWSTESDEMTVPIEYKSLTASSTLTASGAVTYSVDNLADGDEATAWLANQGIPKSQLETTCRESETGPYLELGSDQFPREWIEWEFHHPVEVHSLEIGNGYTKSEELLLGNSRIRSVVVSTDNGERPFQLKDSPEFQSLNLTGGASGLRTTTLRVAIQSIYCGTAQYIVDGEPQDGSSHPSMAHAAPLGLLDGVIEQGVLERGLIVADRVSVEDSEPPIDWEELPSYGTQSWINLGGAERVPVSAEWRVAWSGNTLYVEARVADLKIDQPHLQDPPSLWKGDSVNFEIGPDSRCLGADETLRPADRHYIVAPAESSGVLANVVNEPKSDKGYFDAGFAEQIPGSVELTDEGYTLRAQIRLSSGLTSGTDWRVLAANFNVSDVGPDDSLAGFASTNPVRVEAAKRTEIVNTRPGLWGTLVLRPGMWTDELLRTLQETC